MTTVTASATRTATRTTAAPVLTIRAADGHTFEAAVHEAADAAKAKASSHAPTRAPGDAPVLVFLSALGTPARVYRRFGEAMAAHGVTTVLPDWRGIASSSLRAGRGRNFGYRHLVEIDAPALLDEIRRRWPGAAIWLGGHSLGGQLSPLVAAHGGGVHGLLPIASGSVLTECYSAPMRLGIRVGGWLPKLTAPLLGYFPGHRLGFAGREATDVMADWAHVSRTGRYEPRGSSFDYEHRLKTLKLPVIAVHFPSDTWAPEAAVDFLLGKLPACQPEKWTCGKADSGGVHLDHFSWTRQPQFIAPRLAAWVIHHSSDATL